MKIYDESLYCQECGKKISVLEYKLLNYQCGECYAIVLSIQQPDYHCEVLGIDEDGEIYDIEPVQTMRDFY